MCQNSVLITSSDESLSYPFNLHIKRIDQLWFGDKVTEVASCLIWKMLSVHMIANIRLTAERDMIKPFFWFIPCLFGPLWQCFLFVTIGSKVSSDCFFQKYMLITWYWWPVFALLMGNLSPIYFPISLFFIFCPEAAAARYYVCVTGLRNLILLNLEGCHVTAACLDSISGAPSNECVARPLGCKKFHLI